MSIFKILLLSVLAANLLSTILMVGKPRDPITPGLATGNVIWNALLAVCVVLA